MSRRAWRISGLFVWTSIPSQTSCEQAVRKWLKPFTSTTQTRQAPSIESAGW